MCELSQSGPLKVVHDGQVAQRVFITSHDDERPALWCEGARDVIIREAPNSWSKRLS